MLLDGYEVGSKSWKARVRYIANSEHGQSTSVINVIYISDDQDTKDITSKYRTTSDKMNAAEMDHRDIAVISLDTVVEDQSLLDSLLVRDEITLSVISTQASLIRAIPKSSVVKDWGATVTRATSAAVSAASEHVRICRGGVEVITKTKRRRSLRLSHSRSKAPILMPDRIRLPHPHNGRKHKQPQM